ncbi:MAG: MFS transporter [Synergistales bacterium]|nr:MFS transporter [Synergistales bacterium]
MLRYLIFATVSVALMLSSIAATSLVVAFPTIMAAFSVPIIIAGWMISIYQLGLTATMPIVGKVSDVLGKKFTLMTCLVLFISGSMFCALSPNIGWLIFFRLIQAIGGGGFMPAAVGIVAEEFPESRQKAIGLFSSIFPIGQIIGPNLGGWLVDSFGWRSVFWVNVPIGLVALLFSALLLHPDKKKGASIDVLGAFLVGGSLASLMLGLTLMGYKAMLGLAWMMLSVAIVLALLLLRHEARVEDPILDIEVLKTKPFIAANVYNFVYGTAVIGVLSLIPTYAASVYGMSALECGLLLTPRSVGMIASSVMTSIFIVRWGYRWPMIVGSSATVVGLFFLGFEPKNTALLYVIMLVLGFGVGTASPAANNACIELMPQRAATITGVRGMFRQTGGAVSVTIATLVLHKIGDMALGFSAIFIGLAMAFMATMPLIFMMPKSPNERGQEP